MEEKEVEYLVVLLPRELLQGHGPLNLEIDKVGRRLPKSFGFSKGFHFHEVPP